jgi:ATP-dependent helicase HrpB
MPAPPLPIESVLPDVRAAFDRHPNVVLSADPGAGKTTRVPLALLDLPWLANRKLLMLEPRRLAARRAATYMAEQLGERAGETVGYRMRGESRPGTRIDVVTEGILTRLLHADPALEGTGLIIFDEFHERSIHADLGLAMALDVQEHLRNDLRILVMSATLDRLAVASLLGDAPVIASKGRVFPVATHYLGPPSVGKLEESVAAAVVRALRETPGDVLVFLPGQREIRRAETALAARELPEGVRLYTLFGEASSAQQDEALAPARAGTRKVILSTSIAETSLTIEGVQAVVDAGLSRSARFDPRRGMSGLVTTPVSRAAADQRRGRAGRQGPGSCYRLWDERQHALLAEFAPAEILVTDLAPCCLDMARWGSAEGTGLKFLDPPPSAHLSQARDLLSRLGALTPHGTLTDHGRRMAELPVHPRFAHMLIRAQELGIGALACDVAALLEERDLLRGTGDADVDLHSRWYRLHERGKGRDKQAVDRVRAQATRLRELLGGLPAAAKGDRIGVLVALAYPERVAKRRERDGTRYQLSGGTGGMLQKGSMLAREEYLAVADVDGVGTEVKIFLAEPLTEGEIREAFTKEIVTAEEVHWDERQEAIVARRVERFGAIEISSTARTPSAEVLERGMIEGIRAMGLGVLPWTDHARSLLVRSEWLRRAQLVGTEWPDMSEAHLLDALGEWLSPYLGGMTKRSHLSRLDMSRIIDAMLSFDQHRLLERLAPTHLTVPTGSRIPLSYAEGPHPVLAVRLQEMFGQTETPTVGGGRVAVMLHLLSPARRPLAVTQDLPSFWQNAYPEVRKEMRGRYPKHYWPENPLEAEPTRRAKPRPR